MTEAVAFTDEDGKRIYTVTDAHGNVGKAEREIVYVDTTPPEITLTGFAEMTIQPGDSFTDPGAAAQDLGDGDLTASVTTEGTVDPETPGTTPSPIPPRTPPETPAQQRVWCMSKSPQRIPAIRWYT